MILCSVLTSFVISKNFGVFSVNIFSPAQLFAWYSRLNILDNPTENVAETSPDGDRPGTEFHHRDYGSERMRA